MGVNVLHVHAHAEVVRKVSFFNPVIKNVEVLLFEELANFKMVLGVLLVLFLKLLYFVLIPHKIAHIIIIEFLLSITIQLSHIYIPIHQLQSDHSPITIKPKVWFFGLHAQASLLHPKPFFGERVEVVELSEDFGLPIEGV